MPDEIQNSDWVLGQNMDEDERVEFIAQKIELLFDTFRKPNRKRVAFIEIEKATDGFVSDSWLSNILSRKGASRPNFWTLKALTDFFKVPPTYWEEPIGSVPRQRNIVAFRQDVVDKSGLEQLSPENREAVEVIIQRLLRGQNNVQP